ncbi:hypothetical protein [Pseudaminobacter sp. NGMCC 1.201702]|uniref:hypothetical protein n=1 Tax=Pseudaminobacter sp. NGMCC 1.201702 TaxID=3391825 RepID=UPI0039EEEDA9
MKIADYRVGITAFVIVCCLGIASTLYIKSVVNRGNDMTISLVQILENRLDALSKDVSNVSANVIFDQEVPNDAFDLLKSSNGQELLAKRAEITKFIFGSADLPTAAQFESHPLPIHAFLPFRAERLNFLNGEAGTSRVLFVRSERETPACLFLYLSGHGEGVDQPKPDAFVLMRSALLLGCDLLHLSMPMSGDNAADRPPQKFGSKLPHNWLGTFETDNFSSLRWFVEPAVLSLNWATSRTGYDQIIAAGRSGGGWTAGLLGALDPRIDATLVFMGSMPTKAKGVRTDDVGDWEQHGSRLYDIVDYGDLYLMSALGEGRRATYFWNKFDTCCFKGARAKVFFPYLMDLAAEWGVPGLNFYVDDTPDRGHNIPPAGIGELATLISLGKMAGR